MGTFAQYAPAYRQNWKAMVIRPNRMAEAEREARLGLSHKDVYLDCEKRSRAAGKGGFVPWHFYLLTHMRESHFRMNTFLGNGQPLSMRTTIVPKGQGPFTGPDAFQRGATRAMDIEGFLDETDWGIERYAWRGEGYNGYGYHGKGVPSPYLYGGSNIYVRGKYVADHNFNPNFVDPQMGILVVLKKIMDIDKSVTFDGDGVRPQPSDTLEHGVIWVQHSLNELAGKPILLEDGKAGKDTKNYVAQFQRENSLPETGVIDLATIQEIEKHLAKTSVTPKQITLPPPPAPQLKPPADTPAEEHPPVLPTPDVEPAPPISWHTRLDEGVREHFRHMFGA